MGRYGRRWRAPTSAPRRHADPARVEARAAGLPCAYRSGAIGRMNLPLPTGRRGPPLVGETLAFLKNGYAFIDTRRAVHGDVFRTRILGRETAVIAGPDACRIWIDPTRILRTGSMPPNVQTIFGGRSLPLLDDAEHRARKAQVLAGFAPEVLPRYVEELGPIVRASLARWVAAGEIGFVAEAKRLAMEGICRNVLGLEPGRETEALIADYDVVTRGVTALPLPLPGTGYTRALKARDRIFASFDRLIAAHREHAGDDGLARMLEAVGPDGARMSDEAARLEIHHVVVAGYIIFAELAAAVLYLERDPASLSRLRAELGAARVRGGPLGADALLGLPFLQQVVMETKRLCPILPAIFGKARTSFEFAGRTVPEGWMVLWAIRSTQLDPGVYSQPERFDPERFAPGRAEHLRHEHGFTPHGPGTYAGHKCPGTDYATLFMAAVLAELVGRHTWELPPQDTGYAWGKTPPEPRDGLRLRLRASPT
jgi:retinoid hydroxylase